MSAGDHCKAFVEEQVHFMKRYRRFPGKVSELRRRKDRRQDCFRERSWRQRGQVMVLLAGIIVFLVLLLGLVIDSVRLYILSAQAERAAEAGALAGALYLPDHFMLPAQDGQSASKRACDAVRQNGVANCPASTGQPGAAVDVAPSNPYVLEVTVTETLDTFFLTILDPAFANATVQRTARAEYLPQVNLGSPQASFGDQADSCAGSPCQLFWASISGPLDLKEQGDAYSPQWEEGPSDSATTTDALWSGPGFPAPYTTVRLNTPTNHPQYSGSAQPNPDQHPPNSLDASGVPGYSYDIEVPASAVPATLSIYNAPFDPGDLFNGAATAPDAMAGYAASNQAANYMQVHYSLFSTPIPFEPGLDQLVLPEWSPDSLDLFTADLRAQGCATNGQQAYDTVIHQCIAMPAAAQAWTSWATLTQAGHYRLVVSTTGSYGAHRYGLKVTPAGGGSVAGLTISGQTEECVRFDLPGSPTTLYLAEIPAAYAGHLVTLDIFDLGDVLAGSNVGIQVFWPDGTPLVLPSSLPTVPGTNNTELNASSYRFNGLWVHIPIALPATYAPAAGQDWFTFKYFAGNTHDTVTIHVTLAGGPVHLVV